MFHIQFNQHSKLIKKPSSTQIKDHKAKEFIKILINKKKKSNTRRKQGKPKDEIS